MIDAGQRGDANIFRPFGADLGLDPQSSITVDTSVKILEDSIFSIHTRDLIIFHSWFYNEKKYQTALICIDMAIAKGAIDSRNFSYRSATLRKLDRIGEAINSANMALEITPGDHDALYNLARAYLLYGKKSDALIILDKLRRGSAASYADRLAFHANDATDKT